MSRAHSYTPRTWLTAQLIVHRIGLGQGLSIRKLTQAALQAGHPEHEFRDALDAFIARGLLAPDSLHAPARTVVLTLSGYERVQHIRQAYRPAPAPVKAEYRP